MNRQLKKSAGVPTIPKNSKKGSIVCFDSELKEQPLLRYNAFSDEIEMNAKNSDNPDQALLKNSKIHCTIDGVTYKYLPIPKSDPHLKRQVIWKRYSKAILILYILEKERCMRKVRKRVLH